VVAQLSFTLVIDLTLITPLWALEPIPDPHYHVCKSEGGDEVLCLGFLRCLSLVEIKSVGWLKNTLIWSPRVSPYGDIEKGDWGAQKWYVPDDK
jgi:hypothetical protein